MKKVLIPSILMCFFMFSVTYAGTLVKKVYFSTFPIYLNGEEYASETPILNYQGRTYIALREFSNLVGVEVGFKDNSIILGKDGYKIFDELVEFNKNDDTQDKEIGDEKIVYISASGGKYHYVSDCNDATYYPIEINKAIKNGYTACLKCVK